MTSLFASEDIAVLVAAFPPPIPKRNQPSLVRSNSGNGLCNSNTALHRFRTLLETEPHRIRKSDLPHRLGIERIDWLIECYDGSPLIRWSRDGVSLIPQPVWMHLIEDLSSLCDENFISVQPYAKAENVEDFSADDLDKLMKMHHLEAIGPLPDSHIEKIFVASSRHLEKTRAEIQSSVDCASDEKLDLCQLHPTMPMSVLKKLTAEIVPNDQLEVNTASLLFVPANYSIVQQERQRADREARLQDLLEKFENQDFIQVNTDTERSSVNDAEDICIRYSDLHADVENPVVLHADAANKVVALPALLERTIHELKEEAATIVSSSSENLIDSFDDKTKSRLCSRCSNPGFASIVLKTPSYSDAIVATMREARLEREQKQHERFSDYFRREVLAPIQLYAYGVESITDTRLKSSLNDHLCTHFRNDAIPSFFKSARADGLLVNNKAKLRETDKFIEAQVQTKTVLQLATATIKYAKKIKLQAQNREQLAEVRREILERKAFMEMPKMSRGSDVLQNLVWILLSVATEKGTRHSIDIEATNGADTMRSIPPDSINLALFMSAGKDTSRMLRWYSAVAHDEIETSKRLGVWRDTLKEGTETKEDFEEMIGLAQQAARELCD